MNRSLAHFLSFVGHPLFVVSGLLALLISLKPFAFGLSSWGDERAFPLFLMVFFSTFFIPGVAVLLLKPLGFIDSMQLKTPKERHAPYIIASIFYLWVFKNSASKGILPHLFNELLLGATLGLFLAFFVNIFFKISAHAVGMGGFLAALFLILKAWGPLALPIGGAVFSLNLVVLAAFLLAGAVLTARLALGAHSSSEIWSGLAGGAAAMLAASALI